MRREIHHIVAIVTGDSALTDPARVAVRRGNQDLFRKRVADLHFLTLISCDKGKYHVN